MSDSAGKFGTLRTALRALLVFVAGALLVFGAWLAHPAAAPVVAAALIFSLLFVTRERKAEAAAAQRLLGRDVAGMAGALLVSFGAALVSPAAGAIVAGLMMLAGAWLLAAADRNSAPADQGA